MQEKEHIFSFVDVRDPKFVKRIKTAKPWLVEKMARIWAHRMSILTLRVTHEETGESWDIETVGL